MAPTAQFLIDWRGWRTTYLVFAIAVAALLPILLLVPWRRATAGHPDYVRTTGGGTGLAGQGMTLRQAFATPVFWGIVWSFIFTGIGMYTVSLQAPAYLVHVGYTSKEAAEAFGIMGFLLPVGVIGFGWLSVRIGRQRAMLLAYATSAAGILALVGLAAGPSLALLGLFAICFGGSFGSRGPAVLTIAALNFQGPHLGRIYGMLTIGMGGGGAIGAWLGGILHDLTGDYQAGLWTGIASLFLATLPFLLVRGMARS
jgi:MFS family permease